MREILFRGKRFGNSEWVIGGIMKTFHPNYDCENEEDFLSKKPNCYCVCANNKDYFVEQESIGQYTGLTDKNGKKIFDGDILVFCKGATYPIKVYWDGLGWKFLRNGKRLEDAFECNIISHIQSCEIIGNIHDNPELLKGE